MTLLICMASSCIWCGEVIMDYSEGIVYGFVRLKHGTAEIIWS